VNSIWNQHEIYFFKNQKCLHTDQSRHSQSLRLDVPKLSSGAGFGRCSLCGGHRLSRERLCLTLYLFHLDSLAFIMLAYSNPCAMQYPIDGSFFLVAITGNGHVGVLHFISFKLFIILLYHNPSQLRFYQHDHHNNKS